MNNDDQIASLKEAIRELVWMHADGNMSLKAAEGLANHLLLEMMNWKGNEE